MSTALIVALCTGIPAIIAAVTALVKALKTDNTVKAHLSRVQPPPQA